MTTYEDVVRAAGWLRGVAVRTPVLHSAELDAATERHVLLKAENLQRTGSFKFRGAYVAAGALTQDRRGRGLCTVSSGNFGRALALSGQLLGIEVTVHMPADAPKFKREAVEALGGSVIAFDRLKTPQVDIAACLAGGPGPQYISAHDNTLVISGAGTLGLEFFEDVSSLDALVMPSGRRRGACRGRTGGECGPAKMSNLRR